MNKATTIFDRLQRSSVMIMYMLLCLLIFFAGIQLLQIIPIDFGVAYAMYTLFFLLTAITFGSWFWVALTIPGGVAREFDTIKNKIATGEISSINDFSENLAGFLTRYFHFVGFDIVLAVVKIKYGKTVASSNSFEPDPSSNEEWIVLSKSTQDVVSVGKLIHCGQKLHGYLIPIWFCNEWLGYILIFTDTRLIKLYQQYLRTFEDLYIDDQVLHLLHRDDNSNTRRLCQGTDILSREIEEKSIISTTDYLTKLINLLLMETSCKAGFIKPPGNHTVITANIDASIAQSISIPESDKTFRPEITGFEIATVKIIKTLNGETIKLVLLGDTYESIILARSLLDSCLANKIEKQYLQLTGFNTKQ